MQLVDLIGKGAEILKHIAEKEPDKQELRRHWSSRTVWKQIRRLQRQGLVVWQDNRYQATDPGLYNLARAWAPRSRVALAGIVKIAAGKFPNGATMQAYDPVTRIRQPTMKKLLKHNLGKPNTFVLCRTDAKGQVAWAFSTNRGPEDLRISQRVHGRWQPVRIPRQSGP